MSLSTMRASGSVMIKDPKPIPRWSSVRIVLLMNDTEISWSLYSMLPASKPLFACWNCYCTGVTTTFFWSGKSSVCVMTSVQMSGMNKWFSPEEACGQDFWCLEADPCGWSRLLCISDIWQVDSLCYMLNDQTRASLSMYWTVQSSEKVEVRNPLKSTGTQARLCKACAMEVDLNVPMQ